MVESFQSDSYETNVFGLTADEAELLEPPPAAAFEPWVVPLTVRRDDIANETADETGDD